jgi:membrane protease YdiL (CAAX protease family)
VFAGVGLLAVLAATADRRDAVIAAFRVAVALAAAVPVFLRGAVGPSGVLPWLGLSPLALAFGRPRRALALLLGAAAAMALLAPAIHPRLRGAEAAGGVDEGRFLWSALAVAPVLLALPPLGARPPVGVPWRRSPPGQRAARPHGWERPAHRTLARTRAGDPEPYTRHAMRRALPLLLPWLGLLAVLIGLAYLVAPPLHRSLVDAGVGNPERFDRTVRYVVFVPFLLVLFARLRPWRDGTPWSYGKPRARAVLLGYGLTFLVAVALLALQYALGWLVWEHPLQAAEAVTRVLRFLGAGFLIALLEEWFFRGWMDRRFQRFRGPRAAALLVALVYAVLHTFSVREGADAAPATRAGVLEVLGLWVGRLVDPAYAFPKIVGLALFSLLLTAAYRRTKTLSTAVGIHAAAICVLYSYGALTDRVPPITAWTGTKKVYDGFLGWVVLGAALLLVARPWKDDALGLPEPIRQRGGQN